MKWVIEDIGKEKKIFQRVKKTYQVKEGKLVVKRKRKDNVEGFKPLGLEKSRQMQCKRRHHLT